MFEQVMTLRIQNTSALRNLHRLKRAIRVQVYAEVTSTYLRIKRIYHFAYLLQGLYRCAVRVLYA